MAAIKSAKHANATGEPGRHGSPALVVVYRNEQAQPAQRAQQIELTRSHESMTRHELGRRLAAIKKLDFGGEFQHGQRYEAPLYYVPSETLCQSTMRTDLGIRSEHDLFGGVVPYPFVATKVITHGLIGPGAAAPQGWSAPLANRLEQVVLPGYSVFDADDARCACKRLLEHGGVRVKKASGIGGLGQWVVEDLAQLDTVLGELADHEIRVHGLVLELNLSSQVATHSVGQVRVGDLLATYCGTQQLARNNSGQEVYGGSRLTVVRGDFDALNNLNLAPEVRAVIDHAGQYHAGAMAAYPGLFASRCNYDVVTGADVNGRQRCGVLEQSWRAGGASGAEIAALEAFQQDPALEVVQASTTEVYGEAALVPPDAVIYFDGIDEQVGRLTKFSRLENYVHP